MAAVTFIDSTSNYANGTSVTVTAPTGIQNDDLLVATVWCHDTSSKPTPPSGFTEITGAAHSLVADTSQRNYVWYKRASSESGDYTFTIANGSYQIVCAIAVFRSCLASGDPVDVISNTEYVISDSTIRAASMTTTEPGCRIWWGYAIRADTDLISTPSGWTTAEEISPGGTSPNYHCSLLAYQLDNDGVTKGSTGDVDGTLSGGSIQNKHAVMVEFKGTGGSQAITVNISQDNTSIYAPGPVVIG